MGAVKVRDEKGRVKETWIRPNSSAEGLARILLREMWNDAEGRWISGRRPMTIDESLLRHKVHLQCVL